MKKQYEEIYRIPGELNVGGLVSITSASMIKEKKSIKNLFSNTDERIIRLILRNDAERTVTKIAVSIRGFVGNDKSLSTVFTYEYRALIPKGLSIGKGQYITIHEHLSSFEIEDVTVFFGEDQVTFGGDDLKIVS